MVAWCLAQDRLLLTTEYVAVFLLSMYIYIYISGALYVFRMKDVHLSIRPLCTCCVRWNKICASLRICKEAIYVTRAGLNYSVGGQGCFCV